MLQILVPLTFAIFCLHDVLTYPLPRQSVTDDISIGDHALISAHSDLTDISLPAPDVLLDLTNFTFVLTPKSDVCSTNNLYFLVLVHSSPENFELRNAVRDNWGSVKEIGGNAIRVLFLLGSPENEVESDQEHSIRKKSYLPSTPSSISHLDNDLHGRTQTFSGIARDRKAFRPRQEIDPASTTLSQLQKRIENEAEHFGDIIQGNFIDNFHNLSYKHMMGFKWLEEKCQTSKPAFVVKADDDVFIETFHLYNFVSAIYGQTPKRSLVCDVVPTGTTPRRREKFSSHLTDYTEENYPEFCSGMAYLVTPDLATDFIKASTMVPKFLLDDIYVTGYLRELLGLRPFYLNLRYTYEEKSYLKWLHSKQPLPLPYLFASVETSNPDWKSTLEQLWVKTLSIHLGTTTTSSTTPATSTTTASTTTTTVTPSTTVTTTTATTSRSKVSTNHDSATFEVIVGISKSQEKID